MTREPWNNRKICLCVTYRSQVWEYKVKSCGMLKKSTYIKRAAWCTEIVICANSRERLDHKGLLYELLPCIYARSCFHSSNHELLKSKHLFKLPWRVGSLDRYKVRRLSHLSTKSSKLHRTSSEYRLHFFLIWLLIKFLKRIVLCFDRIRTPCVLLVY